MTAAGFCEACWRPSIHPVCSGCQDAVEDLRFALRRRGVNADRRGRPQNARRLAYVAAQVGVTAELTEIKGRVRATVRHPVDGTPVPLADLQDIQWCLHEQQVQVRS